MRISDWSSDVCSSDLLTRLAATGAIGCNIEDQVVGGDGLHAVDAQATRIAAAREAVGADFFINARTDIFLKAKRETHDAAMVDSAIARAHRSEEHTSELQSLMRSTYAVS